MRALTLAFFVGCLLSDVGLSQESMPFPLEPDGMDEISGQLKLSPSNEAISGLPSKESLVLRGLTLPGGAQVDLELTRIPLERLELGFHVNGRPTPGLLVGLDLSVWKGRVVGEPDSDVMISFSSVGTRGWIGRGNDRFHLMPQPGDGLNWSAGYSVIVESRTLASLGVDLGMTCGSEKLPRNVLEGENVPGPGSQFLGGGGSVTLWECAIAIETDFQLNQLFGGDLAAETAYITTLIAAGSDRYIEQNNTRLVYPYVQFYTTSADPWSSQDAGGNSIDLLNEFVAAWSGAQLPGNADLGHFLSGASLGGGVAYLSVLCDTNNDFAFGVSGSLGGNVPFPIQQGPVNWDFIVFTHELGHNFSSPHTHDFCPPIDRCAPMDYFGSCQTSQVCTSMGSIMSYCHLCPNGMNNMTTFFHPTVINTIATHVQSCLPTVFGIDASPPTTIPPGVPTQVTATVFGTPTTVELSYRYSPAASYTVVSMTNQGGGVYAANLPSPACTDQPEFFFSISNGPDQVSTEVFTAVVGNQTTTFADNFQSDMGWTAGAVDDNATTGLWTRVDPNPTTAQPGEGVNPASGPFCFVTGQGTVGGALGDNDVDGGKTTLFSPVFNLTGTDPQIGYWRWYSNTTGASANADIFEVEVTANGTTWIDVETIGPGGTATNGGWNYHQFVVSDFVTPGSQVQVRFIASDEGAGSIIEAAIDDFQVFTVDCPTGPQPPTAQFSGSPLTGAQPLTVSFTDATTGSVSAWSWTFGDTTTSSAQSPSHTYSAVGTYTVSLSATGPDGADVETKTDYIVVTEQLPVAGFSATPTVGIRPLTVSFTDTTSGPVTSWLWSFGDLDTSTDQNPVHTYSFSGTYTVSMAATGPGGSDVETKSDYIVVTEPLPMADFSATPTSGARPLAVSFTDTTSGPVTSWLWSFGDLVTSTAQNPVHTYTISGSYTVSMAATGPGGSDVETKTGFIVVTDPDPPPMADFSATPTSGVRPLAVSFTDTTSGPVSSWLWSFGDLVTSTAQNPVHTYTISGTYTVSMSATGPGGSDIETKTDYIVVADPPPIADFNATPTSGVRPLTVSFTDTTSGPVSSWLWSFGDLVTSTDQNPVHTYTIAGTYTVSMAATGSGGSDVETKTDYIVVSEQPPVAQFSGTPLSGLLPLAVSFTDETTGVVTARAWNFGDTGTSAQQNPTHTYNDAGTYTVSLTATGPGGPHTETKTNYVVVSAPSIANFSASPESGGVPLTVAFTDLSTPNVTGWSWDFGDTGSSSLQDPTHTYTTAGTYSVSLTVEGPGGSDTLLMTDLITVHPAAQSIFRNGTGLNPACFLAAPPVIGTLWIGAVDSSVVPGTTLTVLLARTQSIPGITLSTGELLIDPSSGFLFNSFAAATGGLDQHSFGVPMNLSFVGNEGHLQAFLFGPTLQWCNAAALTVGFPTLNPTPTAGFNGAPQTGPAPHTVFFNDTSSGAISGWSWSFGDGAASTLQNPTHVYTTPGTYPVSLTVQGEGGFDTSLQLDYISVQ